MCKLLFESSINKIKSIYTKPTYYYPSEYVNDFGFYFCMITNKDYLRDFGYYTVAYVSDENVIRYIINLPEGGFEYVSEKQFLDNVKPIQF